MSERGQGRGRGQGRNRGRGRRPQEQQESAREDVPLRTGLAYIERSASPTSTLVDDDDLAFRRLPSLRPATGPPIEIEGFIGGAMSFSRNDDPRLKAVSLGFPISVHPLRIPNTRAQMSTGSSHSVIDFRFVRLAGLLHQMIPLRPGVDNVKLGRAEVLGYVDVLFDALGYEFKHRCWVIHNVGLPVEIQLGNDWSSASKISFMIGSGIGNINVLEADAKKVRKLQDSYVTI